MKSQEHEPVNNGHNPVDLTTATPTELADRPVEMELIISEPSEEELLRMYAPTHEGLDSFADAYALAEKDVPPRQRRDAKKTPRTWVSPRVKRNPRQPRLKFSLDHLRAFTAVGLITKADLKQNPSLKEKLEIVKKPKAMTPNAARSHDKPDLLGIEAFPRGKSDNIVVGWYRDGRRCTNDGIHVYHAGPNDRNLHIRRTHFINKCDHYPIPDNIVMVEMPASAEFGMGQGFLRVRACKCGSFVFVKGRKIHRSKLAEEQIGYGLRKYVHGREYASPRQATRTRKCRHALSTKNKLISLGDWTVSVPCCDCGRYLFLDGVRVTLRDLRYIEDQPEMYAGLKRSLESGKAWVIDTAEKVHDE